MTQEEVYKVRMLLAQAKVASLERQVRDMDSLFNLVAEMANHLHQFKPDDFEWPKEIQDKLDNMEAALTPAIGG